MDNKELFQMLRAYGSLAAIIAFGLVGIVFLIALWIAYRRHIYRKRQALQRRTSPSPQKQHADLWCVGGQRLSETSDLESPEEQAFPFDDEDIDEEDDDDDEKDDDSWWPNR
jgi:hypothetical protein